MEDADRDNDVSMEGGDPTPSSEQEPTEGGDHSMDSSVDDEEASASQPDPEASVERVKKQQRQKLRELREQQKKDLEVEKVRTGSLPSLPPSLCVQALRHSLVLFCAVYQLARPLPVPLETSRDFPSFYRASW